MCGISGFFSHNNLFDENDLKQFNYYLRHRGPDDSSCFFSKELFGSIGLSHVRLSILDLSVSGRQPMEYDNLVISYNGEVYNYLEIRSELLNHGYHFTTGTDTEVVLKAFHLWGTKSVSKFVGMFAFAIHDKVTKKIFLCRDRAGVKPLFYFINYNNFIFSSELKVFLLSEKFSPEISIDSLNSYMAYGYVINNKTILKNVYKLNPGTILTYDIINKSTEVTNYWNLIDFLNNDKFEGTYDEALIQCQSLLVSSIKYRTISDAPLGVFLSSGYDSSLVAALLQMQSSNKIKTFTIGFTSGEDESYKARQIANYLDTNHESHIISSADIKDELFKLPHYFDDLIADESCIPSLMVAKIASKDVKVALTGDGGDELFGGYSKYIQYPKFLSKFNKIPNFSKLLNLFHGLLKTYKNYDNSLLKKVELLKIISNRNLSNQFYLMHYLLNAIPSYTVNSVLNNDVDFSVGLNNDLKVNNFDDILYLLDFDDVLRDYFLVKSERACMSFSLEGREPLLDHNLIEFVSTLPSNFKCDGIVNKKIIKDIVHKFIPLDLMSNKKIGFNPPLYKWLSNELSFFVDFYLSKEVISLNPYLNYDVIRNYHNLFKQDKLYYKPIIWRVINFQMWYDWYFNNKLNSLS